MSKYDVKYNLANRALKAIESSFGYEYENKDKIRLIELYFRDLQFNNNDLYSKEKINLIEDKQYSNFVTRMQKSSFHKNLKNKDLIKEYPNIVGEIFALLYSKNSRSLTSQFFTPQEVANEIMIECENYFDTTNIKSIYDPCCGAGSLAIAYSNSNNKIQIYVNELPYVENFYKLNFSLNDTKITAIPKGHRRARENMESDLCLLNPPFKDCEVMNFLEVASESKYLILIMPTSFDTSRSYKKSYQYFVDNFNILGTHKLDNDCFSWHGVAVNTIVYYCANKHIENKHIEKIVCKEKKAPIKQVIKIEPKKQTIQKEAIKQSAKIEAKNKSISKKQSKEEVIKIEAKKDNANIEFLEKMKTINFIIRRVS